MNQLKYFTCLIDHSLKSSSNSSSKFSNASFHINSINSQIGFSISLAFSIIDFHAICFNCLEPANKVGSAKE